ncbi:hypothetical protein [Lysinibacillus pakistanensis]|uniref:GNAT family N-acetyltransferase n=1 Tax=Lysinibacillus pakistanensis TaxID=759811 RepID=A0AAX3WTC3_9BACI|nr:hypothetical protein [Lysinibacillus pakistanensis]MDM5230482.1 hypothetical protein [Lysinibacillus pakistanensis]WHY46065.1 hypothetical protein QNH22_22850 [Lysinibacillus pakistanensis]WHY51076.1 hypothetical protein QNH24_22810 [Lysinibacillus pakistanensis]
MQTIQELYTYEILTKDQPDLIEKAAECLAKTFIGVEVAGKWVQEPIIGYALQLPYEDFYQFTKEYIEANVHQGYCAIALDKERKVVGALVGDTNVLEIMEEDIFEGTFSNMNIVMHVLEDIDKRFLEDYKKRYGKNMEDGEVLHLFLLGVIAEHNRHEIVQGLGDILVKRARKEGLRLVLGEATNPKSLRLMEKYHDLTKYVDIEGNFIVHKYESNEHLSSIPSTVADGIYIIVKEL